MPPEPLQVVRNRLKSDYPRPDINPEWLSACVLALQQADPTATVPKLIRSTETQLLLSDLSASCLHNGTGLPPPDADDSFPLETILFGPAKKDSCLVMITSVMEIGSSAFQLSTVKQQRAEALSGAAKIRRLRVGPESGNGGGDGAEEEEEELADGDLPPYPRGMLMLEVSDGHRYMKAMEYKRIGGLLLGETSLGSKLVLRNVRALRGILLLTAENATLKGHMVEEMEELQGHYFESGLRVRMGKPPLDFPAEGQAEVDAINQEEVDDRQNAHHVAPQHQPQPIAGPSKHWTTMDGQTGGATQFLAIEDDDDSYDMDLDDDLLASALDGHGTGSGSGPGSNLRPTRRTGGDSQSRSSQSRRSNRESARTDQTADFPDLDEEDLHAALAIDGTQRHIRGNVNAQTRPRRNGSVGTYRTDGGVAAAEGMSGDDDDEDGAEWAALAEIDEEEKRAARFTGYKQARASTISKVKRTLPARLDTRLPSRAGTRTPGASTSTRDQAKAKESSPNQASQVTPGEVSRFFAAATKEVVGKGKGRAVGSSVQSGTGRGGGQEGAERRQRKTRTLVSEAWLDVDSVEEETRSKGCPSRPGATKRNSDETALSDIETLGNEAEERDEGSETSEDSTKENRHPSVARRRLKKPRMSAQVVADTGTGSKGRPGGGRKTAGVIDLLGDSD